MPVVSGIRFTHFMCGNRFWFGYLCLDVKCLRVEISRNLEREKWDLILNIMEWSGQNWFDI